MGKRSRFEKWKEDFSAKFKTELDNQIIAHNAETDDTITLPNIGAVSNFTLNDRAINYDVILLFYPFDVDPQSVGPFLQKDIEIEIDILYGKNPTEENYRIMYRYQELLEATFSAVYRSIPGTKPDFTPSFPVYWRDQKVNRGYLVTGIGTTINLW